MWTWPSTLFLIGFLTLSDSHHSVSHDWQCVCTFAVIDSERKVSRDPHGFLLTVSNRTFLQSQKLHKPGQRTPDCKALISPCTSKGTNWLQVRVQWRKFWNGCLWSLQNCPGMHTCDLESFMRNWMELHKDTWNRQSWVSAQPQPFLARTVGKWFKFSKIFLFWQVSNNNINLHSQISVLFKDSWIFMWNHSILNTLLNFTFYCIDSKKKKGWMRLLL